MLSVITFGDIIFAAMWALIIGTLIKAVSRLFKKEPMTKEDILSDAKLRNEIALKRCYMLFPTGMFTFKGKSLERGMYVRVTTIKNSVFEGKFVGLSKDNVVMCVITPSHVIAQGLKEIEEISVIE